MLDKFDTISRIVELVLAVAASAIVTRIITIRQRVRQEKSAADKAETEVRADQIENIEKLVEKVYKPTIETLTEQVNELRQRVDELEQENGQLREALRKVSPEAVPSRRGENGRNAKRNPDGTFAKQDDGDGE